MILKFWSVALATSRQTTAVVLLCVLEKSGLQKYFMNQWVSLDLQVRKLPPAPLFPGMSQCTVQTRRCGMCMNWLVVLKARASFFLFLITFVPYNVTVQ